MKFTAALLTFSLLIISGGPQFITKSGVCYAQAHDHTRDNSAPFKSVVNGAETPAAVKETVAYDLFFRSLTFRPDEQGIAESRIRVLSEQLNLTAGQSGRLVALAQYFQTQVSPLDTQAAQIKAKHLLNLQAEDARQLSVLQARKEQFVASFINSSEAQLGPLLTTKLQEHIGSYVKPRIESFQPQAAEAFNRQGTEGQLLNFVPAGYAPPVTQQNVGMSGYGHLYKDGWADYTQDRVFGRGLVTEDYNYYGHTWSVETRVYNPARTRVSANLYQWYPATTSSTASLSLELDDGGFAVEFTLKQFCPYVLGLLALGTFPGPPVNVAPFVRVNPFGSFSPNPVSTQNSSTIPISITASQNARGSLNLEFGYILTEGSTNVTIQIVGSGNLPFEGGQNKSTTATYGPSTMIPAPIKIRAQVMAAARSDPIGGTAAQVINPEQVSADVLTINRP
ncbi:MAG TPA: hypothetical protein VF546_00050 [Pyrinomonadaceae bacterium]|jgi:hypothetical protein